MTTDVIDRTNNMRSVTVMASFQLIDRFVLSPADGATVMPSALLPMFCVKAVSFEEATAFLDITDICFTFRV